MTDTFKKFIQTPEIQEGLLKAVQKLQVWSHGLAREAGWHTNINTGEDLVRSDGEMICLMHSELSEALEAVRKDLMDDHLPHRKGLECELADTVIRIMDYAGLKQLDLAGALVEKLIYNTERADHKIENCLKEGGKTF